MDVESLIRFNTAFLHFNIIWNHVNTFYTFWLFILAEKIVTDWNSWWLNSPEITYLIPCAAIMNKLSSSAGESIGADSRSATGSQNQRVPIVPMQAHRNHLVIKVSAALIKWRSKCECLCACEDSCQLQLRCVQECYSVCSKRWIYWVCNHQEVVWSQIIHSNLLMHEYKDIY